MSNFWRSISGFGVVMFGGVLLAKPPPPAPPAPPVQPSPAPIAPAAPQPGTNQTALVWDSTAKEYQAKAGDTNGLFTFYCTNVSSSEVQILNTHTTCGCTVAQLPSQPYKIAPGGVGEIKVTMDLRGRAGIVSKGVTVYTSSGQYGLTVTSRIPDPVLQNTNPSRMSQEQRQRNLAIAKQDRQAVFKGECAACHATPGEGKFGKELYAAVCGICHDAASRDPQVPDLRAGARPGTRDYWRRHIMLGKPNTLMPAFAKVMGGSLSDEQVFSLVEYLVENFSKQQPSGMLVPSPVRMPSPQNSPQTRRSPNQPPAR
jgi:mono/diheme cytochrome c family protein